MKIPPLSLAAPELVTLLPSDYEEAVRYLASFPGDTRREEFWRDRFRLWWEENPAFSAALERGWLLKDKDRIVGFLGNLPSYFQIHGKTTVVFTTTTWRVTPEYRRYSLRLLYKQIHYAKGSWLFLTTPNPIVTRVIQSFKYPLIPRGSRTVSFAFENFENIIAARLPQNVMSRLFAWGLAIPLKWLQDRRFHFGATDSLRTLPSPPKEERVGGRGICVRDLDQVDNSFDGLWQRTRNLYAHTNVRSREVIQWYCFGSRHFRKKLFAAYRGNSLTAYMIFSAPRTQKISRIECLDLWGVLEDHAALHRLIRSAKEYAQKNSVDLIEFPAFSEKITTLYRELGLFQIRSRERREYFKPGLPLAEPVTEANSYFSYTVGDIGL